jgi:magnesium-transporting ATPase (P-type)
MESIESKTKPDEPQFNKFAYYMAWFAFIASGISIIVSAFKEIKPPEKDDYRKQ